MASAPPLCVILPPVSAAEADGAVVHVYLPRWAEAHLQQTYPSGWGMKHCGMDHQCTSHSVLPATDVLLHYPLSPRGSPPVLAGLPTIEGVFPRCGTLSSPSTPSPHGCRSHSVFSFLLSFFHPTWLPEYFSSPFRSPRYSTSVKQVLCDNCSICRCILDVLVGRGELASSYSANLTPHQKVLEVFSFH